MKRMVSFGEVLDYDQEFLKVRSGTSETAIVRLRPEDLKGTTMLWRGDKVAYWMADSGFQARLLGRSHYEALLTQLNLKTKECICCYCTSTRK